MDDDILYEQMAEYVRKNTAIFEGLLRAYERSVWDRSF